MGANRSYIDSTAPEDIESAFADAFVVPRLCDRVKFELRSPKRATRTQFFQRLARGADMFRAELLTPVPHFTKDAELEGLRALLVAAGAGTSGYVLEWNSDLDRSRLPLRDAVVACLRTQMELIVVFAEGLALYQQESLAAPPRFLLRRR